MCVILHPCSPFPVFLACEPGVHFQKNAEETKLRASTKIITKIKGAKGGVGAIPYFPTPPLLFFLPTPSSTRSPLIPFFFLLTPGALVCSLACSICPPGKWKGNVSYAGSISFAAMLRIMTQWFSPQASRSVARRLEYLKILASCLQEAFLQCSYVLVFKKC